GQFRGGGPAVDGAEDPEARVLEQAIEGSDAISSVLFHADEGSGSSVTVAERDSGRRGGGDASGQRVQALGGPPVVDGGVAVEDDAGGHGGGLHGLLSDVAGGFVQDRLHQLAEL